MSPPQEVSKKRNILVVDDDEQFRAHVNRVLRDAGYNVIQAADGERAMSEMDRHRDRIDLMIVDLCLPSDVNGMDIIIAANRSKNPAKIVAASAVFDQMYLDIALDIGADVAIRKPLESEIAAWSLGTVQALLGESTPAAVPTKRLVVVADDEEGVRQFVKILLQHSGYQVLEAADGETALSLIDQIGGAIDLLITDYQMPRLNGAGLVRAVRAKYPKVPVVYMSGYVPGNGEGLDDDARQHAFIPKPFLPKTFLALVTRMLDGTAVPDEPKGE
jgi:DNA-binding response OmpR family regulator